MPDLKTPTELFIRGRRATQPTELAWHQLAQKGGWHIKIEYNSHSFNSSNHWFIRRSEEEETSEVHFQWFGPYPTQKMRDEQMEQARRHDQLNSGGGISQNVTAPTDRAMINDVFGAAGIGVDAFKPRR